MAAMLFELFSDIFTIRKTRLSGVDSRVKLAAALAAAVLAAMASNPLFPAVLFAAATGLSLAIKIPIRHLAARFAAPAGVAVAILALKTFMTGGETLGAWTVAGQSLTATREGLAAGILVAAKVLGAVAAMQALSFVTPAHQVFRAMRWMGAPAGWVEVAMMMYRFSFDIFERAADVGCAQRTRLGYSTAARSVASAGSLAGAVALGAMERAARVEEAMAVRGYKGGGEIPFGALKPLGAAGGIALAGSIFVLLALFAICERL